LRGAEVKSAVAELYDLWWNAIDRAMSRG
jgi:hypothetical protein